MTGDRRKGPSDAELRDAVLTGWHRLGTKVKPGADQLGTLSKLTGLPFRQLDMVRQVRNRIAHPDGPIPRERLMAALRIIADAELRLAAKKQPRPKPRRQQPAKGRGTARKKPAPKRPPRGKPQTIRRRATLVTAAIITFVIAASVVVFVLLQT
ncbi:hypothetical protein [Actinophytocola sp.]|uniref:hypothetical protein n=1 Tax=Actinophytocola sp. TaxID=1872138 RepID=UPI002ED5EDAA